MSVKQIFTRSCSNTNAEIPGKFVCSGLEGLTSKDDKTSVVKHECNMNLYTITYLYKCRKLGKFVCLGWNELMSKDDKTSE